MRSLAEVRLLLDELDGTSASSLDAQDLDFKRWEPRSLDDSVRMVVEMAVCMANGGGGTVVLGVDDRTIGRAHTIFGVPREVDIVRLQRAVYDRTDPKLTPEIEALAVPAGTGRVPRSRVGVRALVETGTLVGERGAYRLTRPVEQIQVPATVQTVLAARIDRLPAEGSGCSRRRLSSGRTCRWRCCRRSPNLQTTTFSAASGGYGRPSSCTRSACSPSRSTRSSTP